MQDDAAPIKAATTELSADAAEFCLPAAPAEPPAAAAAVSSAADGPAKDSAAADVIKKVPAAETNGIVMETDVGERVENTESMANGQQTASDCADSADSEHGAETKDEGAEAKTKPGKGGSVARMILSLESSMKVKAPLANGLPNGSAPGRPEAHLSKDPIVVQANGE